MNMEQDKESTTPLNSPPSHSTIQNNHNELLKTPQQSQSNHTKPKKSKWEEDTSGSEPEKEDTPSSQTRKGHSSTKKKRITKVSSQMQLDSDYSEQSPSLDVPAAKRIKLSSNESSVSTPIKINSLSASARALESTPNVIISSGSPYSRSPLGNVNTPTQQQPSTPSQQSLTPTYIASPISQASLRRAPILAGCRSVDNYEKLNKIEEGAYGVVFRARDRATGEIVALKKLKLDKEKNGFPITSLREVHTLLLAKHPNIVNVRELVVGDSLNQIFIVMDFIEHDLKSLMQGMRIPFLQSEVKTLMLQLLSAVALLHENWIIHRDLKTSNLLMNNRGQIKVADFGLARKYGSPLGSMTQLVVTLWYRAPELLLGAKEYSTAVDMWSIGCIFGELVNKEPLLPGRTEIDQLQKIFELLGMPNEKIWPGFSELPHVKNINFASKQYYSNLRSRFPYLTENGIDLMSRLLTYDPVKRISAEEALKHPYFTESPSPKDPSMFPTWPSKGSGERTKSFASPSAPQVAHGAEYGELDEEEQALLGTIFEGQSAVDYGFRLKV